MNAFAVRVLEGALADMTWRIVAVVAIGAALWWGDARLMAASMGPLSPAARRAIWRLVLVGVLAVTCVSAGLATRSMLAPRPAVDVAIIELPSVSLTVQSPVAPVRASAWTMAIGLAWGVGTLVSLIIAWRRRRRVNAMLASAPPLSDEHVHAALEHAARRIGVSHLPFVRQAPEAGTAAICRPLNPTLLLTADAASWSGARLSHVLEHELAHLASRDLWWTALARILCVVHWWNPAVHFARRALAAEQEFHCDERAAGGQGTGAAAYAETLVDLALAQNARRKAWALQSIGVLDASLHRRVEALLRDRPASSSARRFAILSTAAIAMAAVLCMPWRPIALRPPASQRLDLRQEPHQSAAPRKRVWIGRDADGRIGARRLAPGSRPAH